MNMIQYAEPIDFNFNGEVEDGPQQSATCANRALAGSSMFHLLLVVLRLLSFIFLNTLL